MTNIIEGRNVNMIVDNERYVLKKSSDLVDKSK